MEKKEHKTLKELIESMEADQSFIEMILKSLLQIKSDAGLKYNEAELLMIEDKIEEMFPEGHKPLPTTLIPFGFYLGKYIIKKIPGAEWTFPESNNDDDIWDVGIKFKASMAGEMVIKPFLRAKKFWMRREDKMSTLAHVACFNSEIEMDKDYWTKRTDDDGWITMASGDMFRLYVGKKSDNDFSKAKGAFHNGTFGDGKY